MLRLKHLRWAPLAAVPVGIAAVTTINDEWDSVLPASKAPPSTEPKEKLLILGTGWAALECLRRARQGNYDITVVSPRPFFLYTPLLAGATVGTVHHGNIIEPIRSFLSSGSGSATYLQANALHVDLDRKTVKVELSGDANLAPTVATDVTAVSPATTADGASSTNAAGRWQWWPFSKNSAQSQPNEANKSPSAPSKNSISSSGSSSGAAVAAANPQADLPYDKLVIAVGARPATFGIPGVEEHAFFLKELDHSAVLQQRLLACLEQASALLALHGDKCKEAQKLLHFVVVGGGPTGVELAAELSDFVQTDVARLFPSLVGKVKLTLLEAAPRVLGPFSEHLAQHATSHLEERGVKVRCGAGVTSLLGPHDATVKAMGPNAASRDEEKLSFGALVWAAGIATRPLVQNLATRLAAADASSSSSSSSPSENASKKSCQPMPRRGLAVDEWLRVKGVHDGSVFALGDCALSGLPPTAQVAAQQGKWLGRQLRDKTFKPPLEASESAVNPSEKQEELPATTDNEPSKGEEKVLSSSPEPFEYSDKGKMAYIGGKAAVATVNVPTLGVPPMSRVRDHLVWRNLHGAVGDPLATPQSSSSSPPSSPSSSSSSSSPPPPSSKPPPTKPAYEERNLTGSAAFAFWRGVYFSKLLSGSNRLAVAVDWLRTEAFGRDIAVHQAQMRRHQTARKQP